MSMEGDTKRGGQVVQRRLVEAGVPEDVMVQRGDRITVYGRVQITDDIREIANDDPDVSLVSIGADEMTFRYDP